MGRRINKMARAYLLLGLLLAAGTASAQQPLLSQGGVLLGGMLTQIGSAINTVREMRNTSSHGAHATAPQPISSEPFSVRVLKVAGSGGPVYEWKASTSVSPANLTITTNETATVKFTTQYSRVQAGFSPYKLVGQVELRNLQEDPVVLEGPVRVLVSISRPPGVTSGPAVTETTHFAACGKSSPVTIPAKRNNNNRPGLLKCTFQAVVPQAAQMMEAVEDGLVAAASATGAAAATGAQEPQMPDVSIVIQATPEVSPGAPAAAPQALSPPYRTFFDGPRAACLLVDEALTGSMAKYLLPGPGASAKRVCGAGGAVTLDARFGGFDASACGIHAAANTPLDRSLGAGPATATVVVAGCTKTRVPRPEVAISQLQVVRIVNHTWSAAAAAAPVSTKGLSASSAEAAGALQLPAKGVAAADFALRLVKSAPKDLGDFIRGEVTVTSTSLVPQILPTLRLAIESAPNTTTYADITCPGLVVVGVVKCTFNAPWKSGGRATVQAQLKTMGSKVFDIHSGTPRPVDAAAADKLDLGECIQVERAYVGESAIDAATGKPLTAQKPLVSIVNGVDALLSSVRVNLTRVGLPSSSVGGLLGLNGTSAGGRALRQAPAAGQELAAALLPYLHPVQVLAGEAPPAPGAKAPLSVCSSKNLTWTEQFGGAADEACGALYNALSALTLTPNGTAAGAQPPLLRNVSLPVLVAGCSLKPAVKLLGLTSGATTKFSWTVSAKALDKKLATAQTSSKPVTARYAVSFNRTSSVSGFNVEPSVVLLNPFAKKITVDDVIATVSVPGQPQIVARLACRGAPGPAQAGGALVLPAAASASAPVPVGCSGKVLLQGRDAGAITITAVTGDGNVTAGPVMFDLAQSIGSLDSEEGRCVQVDAGFSRRAPGGGAALTPFRTGLTAPKAGTELCAPRRYLFNATFGPFKDHPEVCGSYSARYVASIPALKKASAAVTPIAVHSCMVAPDAQ